MDQKNKPNFDELNDRLIAEASDSPSIQIKTNLDSKNVTDANPYLPHEKHLSDEEKAKFDKFFK